jgi:hypothetical protein
MATDKALEVKANVTVDGGKVHPTKIDISSSINATAGAAIVYIHKASNANKTATKVTSKDIFDAMGKRQTNTFKDTPDNPSVNINMEDAYSGSVSFKGNVSSPNYSFSAGSVSLTENIQPDYSALNCMDMSIYEKTGPSDLDRDPATNYPKNIAEFINKVFNDLFTKGSAVMQRVLKDAPKEKKAAYEAQHRINQKVKKFINELFENSKETIGWDGVVEPERVPLMRARVEECLKGKTGGGFLNNILRLAEEFQCVYIPELDNVGKLVNKKELLTNAKPLKIHPIAMSVSAGSVGMFPVRAVVVTYPDNSQAYAVRTTEDNDRDKRSSNFAAIYPKDPIEGGSVLTVLGPQWLYASDYKVATLNKNDNGSRKTLQKNTLTKKNAKNSKKVAKSLDARFDKNEKVVEEWAELIYYWQALGQSYAIVNTELNLKVKVGTRYRVSGDSGVLFSGVLSSVEHTIHTGYKSSTASTQMHFSHIIMGSAEIPGIEG